MDKKEILDILDNAKDESGAVPIRLVRQAFDKLVQPEERTETHACDLISRQVAVELAMKYCPDDDGTVQCDGDIRGLLDELENLPSAQPEQRWIPCSERLPEENGQYLITVKYEHEEGYNDIYAEHGDWSDGKWDMFCFGHCGKVESIIAWMPLPEPYVEGGADMRGENES